MIKRSVNTFVILFLTGLATGSMTAYAMTPEAMLQEAGKISTVALNNICAIDSVNAWAVGDSGTVLKRTANGWETIKTNIENTNDLSLKSVWASKSNPNYVWIVGFDKKEKKNILIRTQCGRAEKPRWLMNSGWMLERSIEFVSVRFVDVNNGVIYGTQGTRLQTHDGGCTWTRVPLDVDLGR
ncbi:MAG: hypothetical protein Q7U71_01250 [bacterium]|nr:hypothetical protein [bacterium]